ncbi:MAG: hypothetical protein V1697_03380 [Candidatus Levyibacteriota bacterium]
MLGIYYNYYINNFIYFLNGTFITEEEFLFRLERRPKHYGELRELFRNWMHEYNHKRLHLGIDSKTPYEVVANALLD